MFEVGFSELVIIALVALLVVGPERLPELVRTAGKWIGRFKRIAADVKAEFDRDMAREELDRLQREIHQANAERVQLEHQPVVPPVAGEPKGPGGA